MSNNIVFNAVDGYASNGQMPAGFSYPLPIGFNSVITLMTTWRPVPLYNPASTQFSWYYLVGNTIVVSKSGLYILAYQ